MTMEHQRNKVFDIITILLVAVIVVIAVLLAGVRVLGFKPYAVLSGSMEPTYHVGSLIYVKPVDYMQLEVGDPITFMQSEDTVVTHRIAEIIPDEEDPLTLRFVTKGDANDFCDAEPVHFRNVLGTVVFTIPYLGYVSAFISKPPGLYFAIAIAAVVLMLVFIPDLFDEKGKKSKAEKEDTT